MIDMSSESSDQRHMNLKLPNLSVFAALVGCVCAAIATSAYTQAQQQPITSVQQILDAVPLGIKLGTREIINPIAAEAASKETNKVLYRQAELQVKVRLVEKVHSPRYQTDYCIRVEDASVNVNGTKVRIDTSLFFGGAEIVSKLARISPKDTITVKGIVGRADFVTSGRPTFMLQLTKCDIK